MTTDNGTTHIVGAGLAGLSTAIHLTKLGRKVCLYEAAAHAGGRCRTFYDAQMDCRIDNGNHLLMSGNVSARTYLKIIGAEDQLHIAPSAAFPFVDLKSGERWTVELNDGPLPFWVFDKNRSIPGVRLADYGPALKFPFASASQTVSQLTGEQGAMFDFFWEPMTLAVLNTTPGRGSARLIWNTFRETFARGGKFCRPMIAKEGLGDALVDPALTHLQNQGVDIRFNTALTGLDRSAGRVEALQFDDHHIVLGEGDSVVLALQRGRMAQLAPDISIPDGDCAIVNAHFKMHEAVSSGPPALLGLHNATTQWIFTRGDMISLTISAADALNLDRKPEEELLPLLWTEVKKALQLEDNAEYAAGRLIRERRATFDQAPESVAKRPDAKTETRNLFLAGDWTNTGLPATIEGAIRSGETAAKAVASFRP